MVVRFLMRKYIVDCCINYSKDFFIGKINLTNNYYFELVPQDFKHFSIKKTLKNWNFTRSPQKKSL